MIVLSLKPRFAEAILAGSKTVELRRARPNISGPIRALLYASSPAKALVGECVVQDVLSDDVDALCRGHCRTSSLTEEEFRRYFKGVQNGSALMLQDPLRVDRPVPLERLRTAAPAGFRPPQGFCYIAAETGRLLLGMGASPEPLSG